MDNFQRGSFLWVSSRRFECYNYEEKLTMKGSAKTCCNPVLNPASPKGLFSKNSKSSAQTSRAYLTQYFK